MLRLPARRPGPHALAFLLVVATVGLVLCLLTPAGTGVDEPQHYARVYGITRGHLVAEVEPGGRTGALLPRCRWDHIGDLNVRVQRPGKLLGGDLIRHRCQGGTIFVPAENVAVYSPAAYLPQAVGLRVAMWLGFGTPLAFLAGRLAGLLGYAALVLAALAIAPRGRSLLLAVGVFPMSLLMASTYSADGMGIGLSILLAAIVLRATGEVRHPHRWFAAALATAVLLSLGKQTLLLLAPLLLLVPSGWPGRRDVLARLAAVGTCVAAAGAWYLLVRDVDLNLIRGPVRLDPAVQLRLVLERPSDFWEVIRLTFFASGEGEFAARTFSWSFATGGSPGDIAPAWVAALGALVLVVAAAADRGPARRRRTPSDAAAGAGDGGVPVDRRAAALSWAAAALPVALVLGSVVATVLAMWTQWTPVDARTVQGLQGRYLLPLLPPLAITTALRHEAPDRDGAAGRAWLGSVGLLVALVVAWYSRYFL